MPTIVPARYVELQMSALLSMQAENPGLVAALCERPYPMADYPKFSQAWPFTARDIEIRHERLHLLGLAPTAAVDA